MTVLFEASAGVALALTLIAGRSRRSRVLGDG
jgi:hypothetical protein